MSQYCKEIMGKNDDGSFERCGEKITHVNVPCRNCGREITPELLNSTSMYI